MKKLLLLFFIFFTTFAFAQPTNDVCSSATLISIPTLSAASFTYNTTTATQSVLSSCDNSSYTYNDVWYRFEMPVNGNVRITNLSLFDGATLYSSCGGAEIACFYNNGFFYNLIATNTYYLKMNKRTIYAGEVTFNIQAFEVAGNDECSASTNIGVTTDVNSYTYNTGTATESLDSSCDYAGNTNLDIWYNFTMPVNGNVRITNISIFDGATLYNSCGGAEIACFYDDGFFYNLAATNTYYLRMNKRSQYSGEVTFNIQAFETAGNDECSASTNIDVTTDVNSYTYNTSKATESLDGSCDNVDNNNLDVWYNFTMPVNGNVRITNISIFDGATLYNSCGGAEIACFYDDDFFYNLTVTNTYYLRMNKRAQYSGEVTFNIQVFESVANDECSGRTTINVETANYLEYTANLSAASESLDASCETASNNNLDLWYEFTMPVSGNLRVTNVGGLTSVSLYDTCGGNEIRCFFGDDFAYKLTGGANYILRIALRAVYAGPINFRVQAFEAVANDECSNRTTINVETANYLEYTANLSAASESLDASCETANNNNLDLWYEFTMPVSGNLRVTNVGGLTSVSLYDACGGNEIRCFFGDDFVYNLTEGQNYILRVAIRAVYAGPINFRVQAFETAPNDECSNALNISIPTVSPTQYEASLASATESLDSTCDNASSTNHDVWYTFTMPVNGTLEVTNNGGLVGVTLYDACGGNQLGCFSGNGNFFNLASGTPLVLRISSRAVYAGTVSFKLKATAAPLQPCTDTTEFIAGEWDNGDPDETKNAIIRTHYDTATYGSFTACSLAIDTSTNLIINGGDYVEVSFGINVSGTLDIEHQGSIVQRDDASTTINNGNIWVRLTTPLMDAKEFMVLGSPVASETRSGVFGNAYRVRNHLTENFIPNPDVAQDFPNAENFADDNYDNWLDFTGTLNVGEGYIVFPQPNNTSSGSYNFNFHNGTLNTGDITFNVKYNTPGPTAEDDKNASPNVLANPYPSAISADDFINSNAMVDEIYFWEHITLPSPLLPGAASMNFSMEDISMYNLMGGIAATSDPTSTETVPNGFISTGQGFGIKATQAGTATFSNNMRRVDNNNTLRKPSNVENNRVLLNLSNTANNLQSTTLIGFSENATSGIDRGYDSRRLASVVSFFSHLEVGDEEFGIQSREPFDSSMKILLGFSSMVDENSEYTISLANMEGPNMQNVTTYLIDNLNNNITNLSETDYTFKAEKGSYLKRFTLQFIESILGTEEFLAEEILVFPNPTNNIINVYSDKATVSKIEVFDIQGKRVIQNIFNNENRCQMNVSSLQAGIYLCKIYSNDTVIIKKIVRK